MEPLKKKRRKEATMPIRAVQQFQLGTVMNTQKEALEVMERMKKAGYEGIELCGFMIRPAGMMVKLLTKAAGMPVGKGGKLDWSGLVKESGLKTVAVHEQLYDALHTPEKLAEEAERLGTNTIVVTGMYRFSYDSEDAVKELSENLNQAGEKLSKLGLSLLYHNHNCEFVRFREKEGVRQSIPGQEKPLNAYELLLKETDPAFVNFEFDSYWAQDGGANPLKVMEALKDRLKLYHINDRGYRKPGPFMTPILKMDSCEPGTGSMDLVSLIGQAKKVNVGAVILETHKNWIDKSPVKSFELSAEFLQRYV